MAQSRLDGLDALRGIAALLVTGFHGEAIYGDPGLFARSYLAVDLFFMLSGFVMARSYETKMAGGLPPLRFMTIRLIRLWPVMAVGAVLGFFAFWPVFGMGSSLILLVSALIFLPMIWGNEPCFPHNPPTWSVQFELFANALHALVLRHLPVRWILTIAALSVLVLGWDGKGMDIGGHANNFWLAFPRVLFSYCVGIVIWRRLGDQPLMPGWLAPALLIGCLLLTGQFSLGPWADYLFVFVLCPLIVVGGLRAMGFGRRPLVWLGDISFPLYAVHYPLLVILYDFDVPVIAALAITLLAAHTIGIASRMRMSGAKRQAPPGDGKGHAEPSLLAKVRRTA